MRVLLVVFFNAVLVFSLQSQSILYVDSSITGLQDGTSWATAFSDLQAAIDESATGDTIFVAQGTYYPTEIAGSSSDPRDKAFVFTVQTRIFGGFDGTEASLSERSTDSVSLHVTNRTTLSGDLGVLNDTSDNAYHVVLSLNGQFSSVIDGFEITDGNASGSGTNSIGLHSIYRNAGGGINSWGSNATFSNCVVQQNYAKRCGAGMNNTTAGPVVTNCSFIENTVTGTFSQNQNGGGAGMRNDGSNVTISNCYFIGNETYTNQGGGAIRNENSTISWLTDVIIKGNHAEDGDGGGGIYNASNSAPILNNVSFINNTTTNQGGAMYNDNSISVVSGSLFLNNHADGGAGAIECDGGSDMELTNCQFIDNSTNSDGGAIQNWFSSPVISHCLFDGNNASGDGGAILNYNNCSPLITSSTFVGNSCDGNGGAIYNRRNSNPILTQLLIYDNYAGNLGGGIYSVMSNGGPCSPIATNLTITENSAGVSGGGAFDDGEGDSRLRNSILYNNTAPVNEEVDAPASSAITNLFYVIIGNEFYTTGVNPPSVVSGQVFLDANSDDFRLANMSAGLNIGDSSFYATSAIPDISNVVTDLEGNVRVMGTNIDLGVYEVCTDTLTPSVMVTVNPTDSVLDNTTVIFNSVITNGGSSPVYQWLKNGVSMVGQNHDSLMVVAGVDLMDGDIISLFIVSEAQCTEVDTAYSNAIAMEVYMVNDTVDTTANDSVNGLWDWKSKQFISVWPNPAGVVLNIESDSPIKQVQVYDQIGREVSVLGVVYGQSNQRKQEKIDVSHLKSGLYLLVLETEVGVEIKKVIIEQ